MKAREVERLNQALKGLEAASIPAGDIKIDTFHMPYRQFGRKFIWPSIHVDGVQIEEAGSIVDLLAKNVPQYVRDCHVLPEARPKKDSNQLHIVRPYVCQDRQYILLFKVIAQYMGGATSREILSEGLQGVTPSIETDRIYFMARLMPVQELMKQGGSIVDFIPWKSQDAIFHFTSRDTARDIFSTILFDEIDYSHVNARFTELFDFGTGWRPGKLFQPFVVDNLAICLNLINPDFRHIDNFLHYFDRAVQIIRNQGVKDDVTPEDRGFWSHYYSSWEYIRDPSKSGNPHWKITREPELNL